MKNLFNQLRPIISDKNFTLAEKLKMVERLHEAEIDKAIRNLSKQRDVKISGGSIRILVDGFIGIKAWGAIDYLLKVGYTRIDTLEL